MVNSLDEAQTNRYLCIRISIITARDFGVPVSFKCSDSLDASTDWFYSRPMSDRLMPVVCIII